MKKGDVIRQKCVNTTFYLTGILAHKVNNIHSRTVYNIFTAQVIRYSRVCNKLEYFLYHLKDLFTSLVKKGCKKRILLKKLLKLLVSKRITIRYRIRCDNQQLQYTLTKFLS